VAVDKPAKDEPKDATQPKDDEKPNTGKEAEAG
jgi:hypothetical protein